MLILNSGTSKVQVNIEKDSYMPEEIIGMQAFVDNLNCDKDLKDIKV
jgi:hypothetical protein